MEANSVVFERIANVSSQIDSLARDLRYMRRKTDDNSTNIEVVKSEVSDIGLTIARLERTIEQEGVRSRESNNRVLIALIGFTLTAGSATTIALAAGGAMP